MEHLQVENAISLDIKNQLEDAARDLTYDYKEVAVYKMESARSSCRLLITRLDERIKSLGG